MKKNLIKFVVVFSLLFALFVPHGFGAAVPGGSTASMARIVDDTPPLDNLN